MRSSLRKRAPVPATAVAKSRERLIESVKAVTSTPESEQRVKRLVDTVQRARTAQFLEKYRSA